MGTERMYTNMQEFISSCRDSPEVEATHMSNKDVMSDYIVMPFGILYRKKVNQLQLHTTMWTNHKHNVG